MSRLFQLGPSPRGTGRGRRIGGRLEGLRGIVAPQDDMELRHPTEQPRPMLAATCLNTWRDNIA